MTGTTISQSLMSPKVERFGRPFLVGLHHLSAFAPWMLLVGLMALSARVYALTGIWPQFLGGVPRPPDGLTQAMFWGVFFLLSFFQLALGIFPTGLWLSGQDYSRTKKIFLALVFITGLLCLWLEPTARLQWFFD